MPNEKTDPAGFSTESSDTQRDMGAKGGPTTTAGKPDDRHTAAKPYSEDTQTQLAAQSTKKKDGKDIVDGN